MHKGGDFLPVFIKMQLTVNITKNKKGIQQIFNVAAGFKIIDGTQITLIRQIEDRFMK
jgi:hypothetical protein